MVHPASLVVWVAVAIGAHYDAVENRRRNRRQQHVQHLYQLQRQYMASEALRQLHLSANIGSTSPVSASDPFQFDMDAMAMNAAIETPTSSPPGSPRTSLVPWDTASVIQISSSSLSSDPDAIYAWVNEEQLDTVAPLHAPSDLGAAAHLCAICQRGPPDDNHVLDSTSGVQHEKLWRILRCSHAFHSICIVRWGAVANRCPLCTLPLVGWIPFIPTAPHSETIATWTNSQTDSSPHS